jgi:hypothetical protein
MANNAHHNVNFYSKNKIKLSEQNVVFFGAGGQGVEIL